VLVGVVEAVPPYGRNRANLPISPRKTQHKLGFHKFPFEQSLRQSSVNVETRRKFVGDCSSSAADEVRR
jgi:hypothetical protein